jgi:hypothetical protein
MNETKNIFQQKLQNHEMPIDDSFWADMEKRLDSQKPKKRVPLWWYVGGVAASFAVLFGLTTFFQNRDTDLFVADNNTEEIIGNTEITENIVANNAVEDIIDKTIENIITSNNTAKQAITATTTKHVKIETAETSNTKDNIQTNQEIQEKTTNTNSETNKNNIAKVEEKQEQKLERKPEQLPKQPYKNNSKKRQSRPLTLAANFSSGGNNVQNENNDGGRPLFLAPAAAVKNITIEQILQDYPEENHLPPLSVGVMLRKNINKTFALESGITYTYLHSSFDKTFGGNDWWERSNATLTQHYIGIPLNAIVNIVNNKTWNFYFSLGGMAEKGVQLKYKQTDTYSYSEEVYNQTFGQDIPGLQWSASAAIGTAYKLFDNISLYFEPKLNYYFDCDQPRSFRTMSPFNLGLNAGVRFEL